MKTFLIPVDFSETSKSALKIAADIAKTIKAKIILTHMAGTEDGISNTPNAFEENLFYTKYVAKQFENFLKVDFLEGLAIETIFQKHVNFDSVVQMANTVNASLIIMGTQGSMGFAEFFTGSNTEKVLRTSGVPVLVIKQGTTHIRAKRLLYASDFNTHSIKAYKKIKEIAKMLKASVEFLYVNTPVNGFKSTSEVDELLLEFFEKIEHSEPFLAVKMVKRYSDYTVEQGVINYANSAEVDIIAMATHGRKGFAHLLQGSITEDVANHAAMPVLTVKM